MYVEIPPEDIPYLNLTTLPFDDNKSFREQDSHRSKREQPSDRDNISDEDCIASKPNEEKSNIRNKAYAPSHLFK